MTTVEKQFVQIFDRKNWIIEQVKRQTQLHSHHLASKLLVNGITPPPWLRNPKFDLETSGPRELKKEELISELLDLHPAPAVPYSSFLRYWHNKPNIVRDNGELSEGLFKKTHESNKGIETGERPTTMPKCHKNDIGCALNPVRELDLLISSPRRQSDGRLSNIHSAPGQSLAEIQRSKSRQKALELRESAKATSKSRFGDENETDVSSNGIRLEKGECLIKEKDDIIFCGRSSCNLSSRYSNSLNRYNSSDTAKEIGAQMTWSESEGVLKPTHLSDTTSQRVTRLKSGVSRKTPLINSLDRSGKSVQNISSNEVLHCPDTDAIVNQEGKADCGSETALIDFDVKKCRLKQQQLWPSLVSSLTKDSTGDQGCLVGKVVITDLSSTVLDTRQFSVEDNQDMMCVGNEFGKGALDIFDCSERTPMERKTHGGDDGLIACGSAGSLCREDGISLTSARFLRSVTEASWPQFKRRRIDGQQTNCFFASPGFRVKETLSSGGHSTSGQLKKVGSNFESVLRFQPFPESHDGDVAQSNADKSPNVETPQNVNYHLAQVNETSPEPQLEQDKIGSEWRYKITNTPSTSKRGKLGTSFVSIVTEEVARGSHGCSTENVGEADTTSTVQDVWKQGDQRNFERWVHSENAFVMENEDDLVHAESILQETRPHYKNVSFYYKWDVSPQNQRLASIGSEQTVSQIEAFTIYTEENEQPHGISNSIDKLNLPSATIERACVLEQLCKTVSSDTPLSQFSTTSTLKPHGTPGFYQSLQNGLLEHMGLGNTLNLNGNGVKQLRASRYCVDGLNYASQGGSYPPYCTSPVGKLWDRNSKSSSWEKQLSLNSELTCYPIEEDHSVGRENENIDEAADTFEEDICSTLETCGSKREPVAETTKAHVDFPTSVSAVENFPDRTSLESVNTEVSFTETRSRVEQKHGIRYSCKRRCKNEAEENRTSSIRTNCVKKATYESLKNRSNGPKLSGKTSLRKGGQSISEKESKGNNIVSNITSFVPLIQQKQKAAIGTGKRHIKVKALQVADAAKRLEEKRQNEGKIKKEALKLERARVEQENFRQKELKKKKKEEEQKRKYAVREARKRSREEEEQKEKERKRQRTEEAQQRRDGKLQVGKMEKEDEKVTNKKETKGDFRKHQKLEKEGGDNNIRRKQQTKPRAADSSTSNVIQAPNDCEAASIGDDTGEPTSILTTSTEKDMCMAETSQGKSYEISPYQCSDGEEDDENEIPTKKFIPSWASKNSVALVLSSQKKVDPDIIFPRESFCSVDEVVRPQKLQQK